MGLESFKIRETKKPSEIERELDNFSTRDLYDSMSDIELEALQMKECWKAETPRLFEERDSDSEMLGKINESAFIYSKELEYSFKFESTENTMLLANYLKELKKLKNDLKYDPSGFDYLISRCEKKFYDLLTNPENKYVQITKPLDTIDELGPGGEIGLITSEPQKNDDVDLAPFLRAYLAESEQEILKESEKSIEQDVTYNSDTDTKIKITPEESTTALDAFAIKTAKTKKVVVKKIKKKASGSPRKKTIIKKRDVSNLNEVEKSEIRQIIERRLERDEGLTKRR